MAKKQFKSLTEMYNKFKDDAIDTVNDIAPPIMKDSMVEAIKIEVYAKYDPSEYERRYNRCGLADKINMKHDLIITDKSVKIMLVNYAKGNSRVGDNSYEHIGDIIVSGQGYTWTRSEIYHTQLKRDFYTVTEELLKETNILNEIKREMRRKGW